MLRLDRILTLPAADVKAIYEEAFGEPFTGKLTETNRLKIMKKLKNQF